MSSNVSSGLGDHFQRETKYSRGKLGDAGQVRQPAPFKRYDDALKRTPIPAAKTEGGTGIWEAIAQRRSIRAYGSRQLSFQELAQLLWATQGVTVRLGGYLLRAAPSAGALYPLETYLVCNRVEGLSPGLYHLYVPDWELEFLREGDLSGELTEALLGQGMAQLAAVVFAWSAVVDRSKWKYKERAYRYIYMDAGHTGENLYLASTALGLGCCTVGAFFDDEVNGVLGIDGVEETALYLGCVGPM